MARKQYADTNRGMLFRVRKKKSERHPDLNGKIDIDGTLYWLSGWFQKYTDSETGEERTGISIALGNAVASKSEAKRVESQTGAAERAPGARPGRQREDTEDDIPF